jgi:hypothetical protein
MDAEVINYPLVRRIITVNSASGASTLKWEADRDCNLIAVIGVVGTAVVSFDPNLSEAAFVVPATDSISDNFQVSQLYITSLIPLSQGVKVYIAPVSGVPTVIQLYLDA